MDTTTAEAKSAARTLRLRLATMGFEISHSEALETVAHQLGFSDWNTAASALTRLDSQVGAPVPVLRVQDASIARDFYVDYLSFDVEWEHQYESGMPSYLRIRRDQATLDLSEHHGDGTPGSVVWIPVASIKALHSELVRRAHPRLRPGIERNSPGGPTIELTDPFGNVLRFCQPRR